MIGEFAKDFMTLVDLEVLVKKCANTSYEARRSTLKEFPEKLPHRYFTILNCC